MEKHIVIDFSEEDLQKIKAFLSATNDYMGLVCVEETGGPKYTSAKRLLNTEVKKLACRIVYSITSKSEFDKYKRITPLEELMIDYKED